jgi:iron complex outermembrane receptor protein
MIRAPKFTGTAMLNWEHDYTFGKVGMNASVYHSSNFKFDVAGSVKQRGYEDVSGQLYYKVNGLRVALFGKNLLNRAVIVGSQPSSSILPLLYGAPRQIGVSLDYEF